MSKEPRPCESDLAFFARVGADISHEMRNVLSCIGEYAGLLDDILALAGEGRSPDPARLKKISGNITRQVRKGTEVMERFSRFAHAADKQTASFDLTALTGNVAALAQRYVTLAGHRLQAELPDKAIFLSTNPFRLQRLVFLAIEQIMQSMENGGLVTVTLVEQGRTAVITISGDTPAVIEPRGQVPQLAAEIAELKGSVEESSADGRPSLMLSFPKE